MEHPVDNQKAIDTVDQNPSLAARMIFRDRAGLEASPGYQKCLAKIKQYEEDLVAFNFGLEMDKLSTRGLGIWKYPMWRCNKFVMDKFVIPEHLKWIAKLKEVMVLPVGFRVGFLMDELAEYEKKNEKLFTVCTRQYKNRQVVMGA